VGPAVIFTPPNLFPLMACKAFSLMIRHGNTAYSGISCTSYGLMILKGMGNVKVAYQWGQIAMQLSEKFEINSVKCQTRFLVNTFFVHWKEPLKNTLEPLQSNYWYGLENGNIEYATYSAFNYCQNAFFCGENLKIVTQENHKFYERFKIHGNKFAFDMHNICAQACLNLFELGKNPTILSGKVFSEEKMIDFFNKTNGKRELFKIYLYKLILSYLFEKYDEAERSAREAECCKKSALGNHEIVIFYFYSTLNLLALISKYSGISRKHLLRKVYKNIKLFRQFVMLAPMNCLHKLFLIEAELCRVTGQVEKASLFFDKAIIKATENDYPNDLALVFELAGRFYQYQLKEQLSREFIINAYKNYQHWGAFNKVSHLEQKYPYLYEKSNTGLSQNGAKELSLASNVHAERTLQDFDIQTIMKAAAAISSEVQLDELLKKLLRISVENAGAQQGYFILRNGEEFLIEAVGSINLEHEVILQSVPLKGNKLVSEAIVQFVYVTRDSLVLENAIQHSHFCSDPIITQKRSKSILCMPIIQQGEVIGLLYLENELMTDAFTQNRIELLKLLAGQMAISLQNALNEQKKINAFLERENLIKKINQHEQELLKTKLEIQEQTYYNISEELHDNIGQVLSLIKINISNIDFSLPDVAKEKLLESKSLLTKVIRDIRDLSKILNTDFIDDIGLIGAIDQQLQYLKKTGLYVAELSVKGEIYKDDSQRELVVFRIVQELLNNIVRHAEATSIDIIIDYQAEKLLITVQDNGRGFDMLSQKLDENAGQGLHNIQNRITLINGTIVFESGPESGTKVTIDLPR
jgi:signal transduction histidine kinase